MVSFFGDYNTAETVVIPFNSFSSNDPSESVTLTNLANTDIYIYKDGSLTQRTSSAGVAVDVDVDGIAGNHWVTVDLSDNTDAGFYVAGSRYQARMEGVTVDSGTINSWIGAWSVGCTLRPTTSGRTLDVESGGTAGIDWGNVANKTTANDLTQTDIQLCDTITTYTGNTPQTADSDTILTALDTLTKAAGAGDLAAIKTVTDALPDSGALTTIGTDTARLTAVRAAVLTDWINGGRLDLILDIIAADTTTDIPALIATAQSDLDKLTGTDGATLATAQGNYAPAVAGDDMGVDAGGVTAIWAFAMTDLAAVPGATAEVGDALSWLYMLNRNKVITDTSGSPDVIELYNNAGILIADSDISDDGSAFTRAKWVNA